MATSEPAMISPEWTFTQRPLRTSRSAEARPIATSTSSEAVSDQLRMGMRLSLNAPEEAGPLQYVKPLRGFPRGSGPFRTLVLSPASLLGSLAMETLPAPLFWTLVLYSLSFPVLCFVMGYGLVR